MGLRSVSALKDVIGEPNQFLHLKFESKPKKKKHLQAIKMRKGVAVRIT